MHDSESDPPSAHTATPWICLSHTHTHARTRTHAHTHAHARTHTHIHSDHFSDCCFKRKGQLIGAVCMQLGTMEGGTKTRNKFQLNLTQTPSHYSNTEITLPTEHTIPHRINPQYKVFVSTNSSEGQKVQVPY